MAATINAGPGALSASNFDILPAGRQDFSIQHPSRSIDVRRFKSGLARF
jgi:hypothetical protein